MQSDVKPGTLLIERRTYSRLYLASFIQFGFVTDKVNQFIN